MCVCIQDWVSRRRLEQDYLTQDGVRNGCGYRFLPVRWCPSKTHLLLVSASNLLYKWMLPLESLAQMQLLSRLRMCPALLTFLRDRTAVIFSKRFEVLWGWLVFRLRTVSPVTLGTVPTKQFLKCRMEKIICPKPHFTMGSTLMSVTDLCGKGTLPL